MFGIFKKSNKLIASSDRAVKEARNWYNDRYISLSIQRNFLVFILLVVISLCVIGALYTKRLSEQHVVKPFVVQVDNITGETQVVNPKSITNLDGNESLHTYFLVKYLRAREEYDVLYYQKNANVTVKLFSDGVIYRDFISYLRSDNGPVKKYANQSTVSLFIRSVSFLETGRVAQIRFRKNIDNAQGGKNFEDKIATITFSFNAIPLNNEDRFENPLGFRVLKYRVDDEIFID